MDFFGNRNIHDIDLIDIEDFFKTIAIKEKSIGNLIFKKNILIS